MLSYTSGMSLIKTKKTVDQELILWYTKQHFTVFRGSSAYSSSQESLTEKTMEKLVKLEPRPTFHLVSKKKTELDHNVSQSQVVVENFLCWGRSDPLFFQMLTADFLN